MPTSPAALRPRSLPRIGPGAGRRARWRHARARACVCAGRALRRPPLSGSGGGAGGYCFRGWGVGVGPGRGGADDVGGGGGGGDGPGPGAGGAGGRSRSRSWRRAKPERVGAATVMSRARRTRRHRSQVGPRANRQGQGGPPSQQPGPLPAARCRGARAAPRAATAPLGLTWGLRGRG